MKGKKSRSHKIVIEISFHSPILLTDAKYAVEHILTDAYTLELFPKNVDKIKTPTSLRAIENHIIRQYITRKKK